MAQQAAEKALKAVILFQTGETETSHKLIELANKVYSQTWL
jgi:HEPN domain-containing protein